MVCIRIDDAVPKLVLVVDGPRIAYSKVTLTEAPLEKGIEARRTAHHARKDTTGLRWDKVVGEEELDVGDLMADSKVVLMTELLECTHVDEIFSGLFECFNKGELIGLPKMVAVKVIAGGKLEAIDIVLQGRRGARDPISGA